MSENDPAASGATPRPRIGRGQNRTPFEQIALLLQGGGALGSYQAGVYQALAEADLHPDWVAGISIGAINSAIIAGNPPAERVARLREFWETVSASPLGIPYFKAGELQDEFHHQVRQSGAGLEYSLLRRAQFFRAADAAGPVLARRERRHGQLL